MKTIIKILKYVAPERNTLIAAAACMLVLSLTTGVYTFLTGPLAKFLISGSTDGIARLLAFIPSIAQMDKATARTFLPGLLVAVAALKGLAYFGQFYLMGMLGQRAIAAIRKDYFAAVLKQDAAFFSETRTGDLLSRFSSDLSHVERAVTYAIASYIRDVLEVLTLLAMAFWLDWKLSLVAFLGVPIVALPVSRLAKKLKRRARQSQQSLGRLTSLVQEGLWGIRIIQAYCMEEHELARFDKENAQVLRAELKAAKAKSLAPAFVELASVAGFTAALWLAARSVVNGDIDPVRLVSFLTTLGLLYQPARGLGKVGQFVLQAIVSGERVFEIIDRKAAIDYSIDRPHMPPLLRSLNFDKVDFAYRDRPILEKFDLELKKGEVVALVGESGAGKSTAALLAMRFADPLRGALQIDGADIKKSSISSVRAQFGLVTQESMLFSGTVADNIAFGRPGAAQEEIEWAAKIADADSFIRQFPDGYQTLIGERGLRLSGGQKQRIAIARALCARAPVLLLDEATSNLDAQSELEVTKALGQALQDKTALVIAHRLSTIRNANRIAVLKAGKIVEEGTHESLILQNGEYARLYSREDIHQSQNRKLLVSKA